MDKIPRGTELSYMHSDCPPLSGGVEDHNYERMLYLQQKRKKVLQDQGVLNKNESFYCIFSFLMFPHQ